MSACRGNERARQHELINLRLAAAVAEDRQVPFSRTYDTIGGVSAPSGRS